MVDLSGGPDGPLEHGFSNTVFIVPGAIIFGLSEEMQENSDEPFMKIEDPKNIPTERIKRILAGEEVDSLLDWDDLKEVLLRREHEAGTSSFNYVSYVILMIAIAFFGWMLYQSIKYKEKKKEEKKKLKQRKKK